MTPSANAETSRFGKTDFRKKKKKEFFVPEMFFVLVNLFTA